MVIATWGRGKKLALITELFLLCMESVLPFPEGKPGKGDFREERLSAPLRKAVLIMGDYRPVDYGLI